MKYHGRVILVAALRCEISVFIEFYNLKKISSIKEFEIFADKDKSVFVAISGIGGINVANLIGFLQGREILAEYSFLVNLGIAGGDLSLGNLYNINKISHCNFSKSFYPFYDSGALEEVALISDDKAQEDYFAKSIYDMEGYYVFAASLKYISLENIVILKIISDNKGSSLVKINKEFVENLIKKQQEKIIKIIADLLAKSVILQKRFFYPEEFYSFIESNKLSFSEKVKLKKEIIKLKNAGEQINENILKNIL